MTSDLSELIQLQAKMVKEFDEKNIEFNINNDKYLNISFVNSKYGDYESSKKEAKTDEIVKFINMNYTTTVP